MDLSKFTFRQIEADTEIKSFDCGDADLNDFLVSDAKNYLRAMMALTYLLEDNEASANSLPAAMGLCLFSTDCQC